MKEWGICKREWPSAINGTFYSAITAVLALIVPVFVLFYTFIATVKNLRNKVQDAQFAHEIHQRSRRRTIRLLGWLIIVFCVCWAPFWIYWILSRSANVFDMGNLGDYQRMRVIRVTILVAAMNATADPLLYGLLGEQFRGAIRSMLWPRRQRREGTGSSRVRSTSFSVLASNRANIASEPSCYSIKALDEEVAGKLTPKSSKVMAHIRQTNEVNESEDSF